MGNSERIESLDFLRGIAILGMLIANVPWHTGTSMSRVSDPDFTSVSAWFVQYAIVDQRFMPIFCMLFGAGIALLAEGRRSSPGFGRFFHWRMVLLFVLGLGHAYLLWPGDILLTYALCGPLVLLFLDLGPKLLVALGVLFKSVDVVFQQWPELYAQTLRRWLFDWWLVVGDAPMSEAAAYAGSYGDLLVYNAWRNQFIQWTAMPYFRMWNALGFMLIGVALFRWGVLQGKEKPTAYRRLLWIGLGTGVPFLIFGLVGRVGSHSTVGPYLGFTGTLPFTTASHVLGAAFTSLALTAGLVLLYRRVGPAKWTWPIRAVGRMALTNYVFHSVFFLIVFAGFQWVPYDILEPDDRLLWVVVIWAIQLTVSPLWISRFGQGPLEKGWRALAGRGPARAKAANSPGVGTQSVAT